MTFRFYLIYVTIPLIAGFVLDRFFGDPLSRFHPVVLIGKIIGACDRKFRKGNSRDPAGGILTVMIVCAVSAAVPAVILYLLDRYAGWICSTAAASLLCWQMLAARGLKTESMKVYEALAENDIEKARYALSMIVGRDTESLDETGIIRAAVETVAENTSDGVTAPMFYMAVFGVPGLFFYKAVNTMDSMIGYKNEKYMLFGRAAARLDDLLNFVPARITAVLMILAAAILPGMSGHSAAAVYRRDHRKSTSPNSGCTESVTAGALGIRLLGPAYYFGKLVDKAFIGDPVRLPEPADIPRTCRLMYLSSDLMLLLLVLPAVFAGMAIYLF